MNLKTTIVVVLCLSMAACDIISSDGGDGDAKTSDPGPYRIIFALDESFQVPHGNQPIRIALVRLSDGLVLEEAIGTVSATVNPAFIFSPAAMMERGISYSVRYWIDSNIGGGTLGLCDPISYDHQWSTEFFHPTNDIDFLVGYEPALMEYVCATFP